jgi:Ala-tRNA(Pro) deacylase
MDVRLEQLLSAKQARYERLTHTGAVTAQHRAAVSHTSGWSMAKVIVVKERDAFVMAVMPACCVLDLDRLAGLIGHGDVRLATVEEIARVVPSCMPGAIPPFGAVFGLRTFVDRSLLRAAQVTMPAGDAASAIRMSSAEFRRLVDGTIGDFAVAEALLQTGGVVRRRRRAG